MVWNQRFKEMLGLPDTLIRSRTSIESIFQHQGKSSGTGLSMAISSYDATIELIKRNSSFDLMLTTRGRPANALGRAIDLRMGQWRGKISQGLQEKSVAHSAWRRLHAR